jgi:hypothetical protein
VEANVVPIALVTLQIPFISVEQMQNKTKLNLTEMSLELKQ